MPGQDLQGENGEPGGPQEYAPGRTSMREREAHRGGMDTPGGIPTFGFEFPVDPETGCTLNSCLTDGRAEFQPSLAATGSHRSRGDVDDRSVLKAAEQNSRTRALARAGKGGTRPRSSPPALSASASYSCP